MHETLFEDTRITPQPVLARPGSIPNMMCDESSTETTLLISPYYTRTFVCLLRNSTGSIFKTVNHPLMFLIQNSNYERHIDSKAPTGTCIRPTFESSGLRATRCPKTRGKNRYLSEPQRHVPIPFSGYIDYAYRSFSFCICSQRAIASCSFLTKSSSARSGNSRVSLE